jgi:hypothetical protein
MTERQPGRADVLLRAGVDQAVARDVDRPRQDVRRHVGDQRHGAGVRRPVVLEADDRLVRADVDVGAPGSRRHSACGGIAVKPLPSPLAATLTVQKCSASAIERFDQSPVLT